MVTSFYSMFKVAVCNFFFFFKKINKVEESVISSRPKSHKFIALHTTVGTTPDSQQLHTATLIQNICIVLNRAVNYGFPNIVLYFSTLTEETQAESVCVCEWDANPYKSLFTLMSANFRLWKCLIFFFKSSFSLGIAFDKRKSIQNNILIIITSPLITVLQHNRFLLFHHLQSNLYRDHDLLITDWV